MQYENDICNIHHLCILCFVFSGYSQMIIFLGKRSAIVMMPGPLPFPHHYLCGLLLHNLTPAHPSPTISDMTKYLLLSSGEVPLPFLCFTFFPFGAIFFKLSFKHGDFLFEFLLQVLTSKCISLIASSACRKCEKDNFVHFLGHNSNVCKAFFVHHKILISRLLHWGFLTRNYSFL